MALTDFFSEIADAIRYKEESSEPITALDFPERIRNLSVSKPSQSGLVFTSCEKINDDWRFNLITSNPTDNYYDSDVAQSALSNEFTTVSLPHDWSIYNEFNSKSSSTYEGGYLDGGDAWYKKELNIENDGSRYFLYFEGVYMESDILMNGTYLTSHKHGYTNFIVEITDSIIDGSNELLVFVKNKQPSSRWYSGSGIYRDVFLIKTGKIGIKQQSVKVTTPDLKTEYSKGYCTTVVDYVLENITNSDANVSVEATVKHFGQEIIKKRMNVFIEANSSLDVNYQYIVGNPQLWDEYDGKIYTLEMDVYNGSGDKISSSETYYGYRWFEFNPDTGFWLNGKNIKLRGACMHHDLGCLGGEINQSAIDRQIMMLKEAGFNAIRLTHNPSCAEFTNACMRMGMMCIEEAFDCWTISKKPYDYARFFLGYAESDVKSMVKRSLNNPCVIMWSLGNEIYDTRSSNSGKVLQDPITTAAKLRSWVREIDTTRPCTLGENNMYDATAREVSNVLDVQGVNYGTYNYHKTYPNWCLYGSETTSAISSRGVYERDNTNYQCSSYDDDKVSWGSYAYSQINTMMTTSYCAGIFIWTGWDYIGEPTPFNKFPARSSYFGIIDIAGLPKDAYYLYKSMWTDEPMCHIVPMDWNQWTVGENVNIMVYSNASYVKMYLNGELVGTYNNKDISDSNSKGSFYGTIQFQKGRLVANAYDANDNLVAQDVLYTSGIANKIKLTSDKLYYKNSEDLLFVEINVCDKDNNLCPFANNTVIAEVQNGTIIGIDNGDATSVEKYRSNEKPVFHGKAVCVIRPNKDSSNVTIKVSSDGLTSKTIIVGKSDSTVYRVKTNNFIDATETYEFVEETIPCTSISINATSIVLNNETNTYQLTHSVVPENTTDVVTYSTDNNSVAIVNSDGLVTLVNNGTCNIIVTCGEQSTSCSVTVENASVDCESITLSETSITLTDTSQYDITATITPENCTYEVSWSSEDENVVTIDNGGHMTAVANGTTNIVATCGSNTERCSVIVELEGTNEPENPDTPIESEWDVEWNGETDSLPVGMNANDNVVFVMNEETGKYEIATTANKTEANVSIDDSVGKGVIEIEIGSTNFISGNGWNNGVVLCSISGKRQVLYTYVNKANKLCINSDANVCCELTNGETYKLRLDNTSYDINDNSYKGVEVYVNDEKVYYNSDTYNNDAATTLSNIWTTSIDTRIKAIRYKKAT